MSVVSFSGYGVNSSDWTVVAARIVRWHRIEYNGRSGTEVVLDNGDKITTEESPYEVERKVREAFNV